MFEPVTIASADPPDDPHQDQRLYVRIAAILRDRIASGELAGGARMPGTRTIKVEFSTSIETSQKALRVPSAEQSTDGSSAYGVASSGGAMRYTSSVLSPLDS